jgi:amino acid adenylation domain-containing protein
MARAFDPPGRLSSMKHDGPALTNRPTGNGVRIGWSDADLQRSIIDRFERIVRQYPQRCAVKSRQVQLTFEALNQAANRIAGAVVAGQGNKNEPVPVLMDEPGAMIPAIMGILKAGKIYVPLDAESSDERLRSIIQDSGAKCIVVNGSSRSAVKRVCGPNTQAINADAVDDRFSAENLNLPLAPTTLASIIYTSGSTGEPKGVLEDHKYILRIIRSDSENVGISPDDHLILLFSLSANGSLGNCFGALLNGATVHCPELKTTARLGEWLREEKITIYYSSASVFRNFAATLQTADVFPDVRVIQLSAEPIVPKDVELCRRHFSPECIFINRFGTTEVGPFLHYKIDLENPFTGNALPVGFPSRDVRVHVFDERCREVGPGTTGQIAVQSRYLSLGYWNKPDLTRTKFLPAPNADDERIYLTGDLGRMTADGCFFLAGRTDFQIKIRGYRVDTAEVEAVLLGHPKIKQAAVLGRPNQKDEMGLVAYYVPARDARLTQAQVRDYLGKRLPEYMVPSVLVKLDTLPTAPSGKVDRRALRSLENLEIESATAYVAPRTALEETLAGFWMEILARKQVGIHDNFLELGGNSLNATQVIARVWNVLGVNLSVRTFLEGPTVATLAEQIERTVFSHSKETMFE